MAETEMGRLQRVARSLSDSGLHVRLALAPGGREWSAKVMELPAGELGGVRAYGHVHGVDLVAAVELAGEHALSQVKRHREEARVAGEIAMSGETNSG